MGGGNRLVGLAFLAAAHQLGRLGRHRVERVALARYGIPDIRLLYDSDVRFLAQVGE